jgi:hypothetical protein
MKLLLAYVLFTSFFFLPLCCSVTDIAPPQTSKEDSARALQRQLQRALDSLECAKYGEPCPPSGVGAGKP